jgi:hypothetical protein
MSRTNRCALWLLPAVFGLGFLLAPRASVAAPGYVNFMFGQKIFNSDWDPIDKQTAWGAEGVFGPARWPVQMDAYYSHASKSKDAVISTVQGTFKGTTNEFGFGANKTFGKKKLHPYVNAGALLAKVTASFSQSGTSGSNDARHIGVWGGGGAFYRLGTAFNIGGAVRYSSATVDFKAYTTTIGGIPFNGASVDAGGFTFGVLVGWGWPKTKD